VEFTITAESKKISVQVYTRDKTEEFAVDSRKLNTALAAPKNNHAEPKKTDVKVVGERARTEVTDM
jgi:hypothetical protein